MTEPAFHTANTRLVKGMVVDLCSLIRKTVLQIKAATRLSHTDFMTELFFKTIVGTLREKNGKTPAYLFSTLPKMPSLKASPGFMDSKGIMKNSPNHAMHLRALLKYLHCKSKRTPLSTQTPESFRLCPFSITYQHGHSFWHVHHVEVCSSD